MGEDLFLGYNQNLGGSRVFGGQVVAQALSAAGQTVAGRNAHSLHAYFLRVGNLAVPIEYRVERVRDGRSFSLRHIVASQSGRAIFNMFASFQVAENGLDHQCQVPEVACPEELAGIKSSSEERGGDVSPRSRQRSSDEMRIELLPVPHSEQTVDRTRRSSKYLWFRVLDSLPDSALMHQCALAYASDFGLLGTARESHGIGFRQSDVQVASLDHAMWFHRDFRCNDWLLHAMDCPSTSNTRGYARGQIFSRDGTLVASVAQEGMIRLRSGVTTAD
jgi:acyl-CoA thioesterase-2